MHKLLHPFGYYHVLTSHVLQCT